MGGLGTQSARVLVVLAVAVVVATVAAGLVVADIDRPEVVATLLFVPVFAVGLLAGRTPGWVTAAAAAVVYLALRSADVDEAGLGSVGVVALTRIAAYVAAAEVGLRAQSLVDRLAAGNEWDDSPLVARGRAFSRRAAPGEDPFGAGQPTSVWQTVPTEAFEPDPSPARAPGWPAAARPEPTPDPPEPAAPAPPPASPPSAWSTEQSTPPSPPTPPPTPWASPRRAWSDPEGTPVVSLADRQHRRPDPWSDAGSPAGTMPPDPPRVASPRAAPPPAEPPPGPIVDEETRLWTARFLRDRIAAEKAVCDATGRSFSLVLVQVPDEPFAALPYRRQVTLLRELGHQFVAGGVIDHLVHVPDRSQHWFAVVLPDIDRTSAQVLERRLRSGIGGYLRSRGLPLSELESASLTAPDDDPALGAIWDALAGRDDLAHSAPAPEY